MNRNEKKASTEALFDPGRLGDKRDCFIDLTKEMQRQQKEDKAATMRKLIRSSDRLKNSQNQDRGVSPRRTTLC